MVGKSVGLLLLALSTFTSAQDSSDATLGTCSGCIRSAGPDSGWCLDDNSRSNPGFAIGCISNQTESCTAFYRPKDTVEPGSNGGNNEQEFIKPERVVLTSRPNVKKKIEFTSKKAENSVDIYFLMDLSASMKDTKKKLVTITQDIVASIQNKTKDLMIGFGGFSEKPTPPFDHFKNEWKKYSFIHYLSMTKNITKTKETIRESELSSANLDPQEAGLDALMQLLLCKKDNEIGWRNNTKGIIVFLTNAPSHFGGDGLLGGLWKPYEHKCNMEKTPKGFRGFNGLNTDYPSVSAVRYELQRSQKSLVFGVTAEVKKFYDSLTEALGVRYASSNDVGADGRKLLRVLTEEYNKIAGLINVQLHNVDDTKLIVKLENNGKYEENKDDKGPDKHFVEVKIKPGMCQSGTANPSTEFQIEIEGQADSKMTIKVVADCECDGCPEATKDQKEKCRSKDDGATMVCGACKCGPNYKGEKCTCGESNGFCENEKGEKCLAEGTLCDEVEKNQCNKCECKANYIGDKCECEIKDDNKCEESGTEKAECENGQVQCKCKEDFIGAKCECNKSGKDCGQNGTASCSGGKVTCKCKSGWTHSNDDQMDCDCTTDIDQCEDPTLPAGEACHGKGKCKCNACKCNDGYNGKFCQKISSQTMKQEQSETCDKLGPCVLQKWDQHGGNVDASLKAEWAAACDKIKKDFSNVYNIQVITGMDEAEELGRECEVSADWEGSGCIITIKHNVQNSFMDYGDKRTIKAGLPTNPIVCGGQFPMAIVIGSSAGAGVFLFLIGFLSYCIVVNVRDRREFQRFQREKAELEEDTGRFAANPAREFSRSKRSSIRKSIRKSLMPGTKVSFTEKKD